MFSHWEQVAILAKVSSHTKSIDIILEIYHTLQVLHRSFSLTRSIDEANTLLECLRAAHTNNVGLPPPERHHRDFPVVVEMEKVLMQTAMFGKYTQITEPVEEMKSIIFVPCYTVQWFTCTHVASFIRNKQEELKINLTRGLLFISRWLTPSRYWLSTGSSSLAL